MKRRLFLLAILAASFGAAQSADASEPVVTVYKNAS